MYIIYFPFLDQVHHDERCCSQDFVCMCAGRRGPTAWNRILEYVRKVRSLKEHAVVDNPFLIAFGLYDLFSEAVDGLIGIVLVKLQFLDRLPHMIIRARDPQVAKLCIDRREMLHTTGRSVNRIAERFCAPGSELYEAFKNHANREGISPLLNKELLPYEWIKLDETKIEGSHRDLSMEKSRCSSTSS